MITNLKPYPSMKDSGVVWLSMVPEHWAVTRLKSHLCLNDSGIWGDQFSDAGTVVLRSTEQTVVGGWRITTPAKIVLPATLINSALLEAGDLVVTKSSGSQNHIGKTSLVNKEIARLHCCFSNFMQRLRLYKSADPAFIWWNLNSPVGREQLVFQSTTTTGLGNLNGTILGNCRFAFPPLTEQAAIVHFLNHAEQRICKYIHTKQKLIELLEEQKQAIIHHAVTRGLDPDAPLKDSGVEWLGDVPEHWKISALRHRYFQHLGKMLDSKRITGNYLLPYLRNIDVQWDRVNVEELPTMDIPPEEYTRYTLQKGDLLVCEGGDVGRCAIWQNGLDICGFQKALHRLRPLNTKRDSPRFMYFVLRAASHGNAFNDGHISTIAHLTGDKLRAHRFPFPPIAEQESIIGYLDSSLNQINQTVSTALKEIELLREYRTRLIAEVVTGKLDVREAAANLPDQSEESAVPDDTDELIDSDEELEMEDALEE